MSLSPRRTLALLCALLPCAALWLGVWREAPSLPWLVSATPPLRSALSPKDVRDDLTLRQPGGDGAGRVSGSDLQSSSHGSQALVMPTFQSWTADVAAGGIGDTANDAFTAPLACVSPCVCFVKAECLDEF
ncbi:MAG: hypothetical protein SGPRY_006078 [Prymnesium sp.]